MADKDQAEASSVKSTSCTSENEAPKTPHDLIKEYDVEIVLKKDKGPDANLKCFTIKDFVTKGDNYACVVSSVIVSYSLRGEDLETSYVVKLNPCRSELFDTMSKVIFEKEIGFYRQLLPLLNAELLRVNEEPLRVPRYLHSVDKDGEQVIYLEDLRQSGYKMHDRKKGMDKAHTEKILTELGRFHAASVLFMSHGELLGCDSSDMVDRFPVLSEPFEEMNKDNSSVKLNDIFPPILENGANIAGMCEGYKKVSEFLTSIKDEAVKMFSNTLKVKDPFRVICHGDCWNNNFLFRYSSDGNVEECRLLDMQAIRVGSPALDLNTMLYCSLEGPLRRKEMNSFLTLYYASFASVMAAAGVPMKFTLPQLKREFYRKNQFGLLTGLMIIPIVVLNSEDAPSIDDFGDNMEEKMKEYQKMMTEQLKKNTLLRPRLLDLFDEMIESGVIN